MTFAASIAVIGTHCSTAGAAMTRKIERVRLCDIQKYERQIGVEYEGDDERENTLTRTQMGERVSIKVWLPVVSFDQTPLETTEADLQDIKARLKTALYGDENLGGNCFKLSIGTATTAKEESMDDPTKKFRTLTIPLVIELADVDTISN